MIPSASVKYRCRSENWRFSTCPIFPAASVFGAGIGDDLSEVSANVVALENYTVGKLIGLYFTVSLKRYKIALCDVDMRRLRRTLTYLLTYFQLQ